MKDSTFALAPNIPVIHRRVAAAACRSPEPARTKLKAVGVAWNAEGRPTVKNGEASPLYYSRAAFPAVERRSSAFALLQGYMLANRPRRGGFMYRLPPLPEEFAIVSVIVNKITVSSERSVINVNSEFTATLHGILLEPRSDRKAESCNLPSGRRSTKAIDADAQTRIRWATPLPPYASRIFRRWLAPD